MAISVVGATNTSATTTVTVATHAVGDYIVIVALRSATTAPTLPAGFTTIVTGSGNANSYRVGYKIATSTTDASGTWTNASLLICTVYSGVSNIGNSIAATKAAATTATIGAVTIANQNSRSWVVAFAGHAATSTQGTPLAGATTSRGTQTSGTYNGGMFDTNVGVNTFSATTSSNTTSVVSCGGAFELLSADSFSTFTDPMTASTQNTSLWGGNFGTLSWSPSGMTVTNPINYTGYGGDNTLLYYDLTGVSVWCQMPTAGNQALVSLETVPFKLVRDTTNNLFWYISGGNLLAIKTVAGVQTTILTIAYVAANMVHFRISESGGTTTLDYSANGTSWTIPSGGSFANVIPMTGLMVEPSLGTFSNEASSTTAVWVSFNTSSGVSASVTQVAATLTATGGTQTVSAIIVASASVTQTAAALTATGGTQSVSAVRNVSITQVSANVTASSGTQAVATVNNSVIIQVAATITVTGGTQSVATVQNTSTTQVAATVTVSGGTQIISTVNNVSIIQTTANVTATGGTQSVATGSIVSASVTQITANVTASGGIQTVASSQVVSVAQTAATLTTNGGIQSVSTVNNAPIIQTAATVTATGGTQVISVVRNSSITQVAAIVTVTSGIQTAVTLQSASISQVAASVITAGGTQAVSTMNSVVITQSAATLTVSGGTQSVNSVGSVSIIQVAASTIATGYAPALFVGLAVGDEIGTAVWIPGDDPSAGTNPTGNQIVAATFSPAGVGTATIGAGDSIGGSVWIPGNQI